MAMAEPRDWQQDDDRAAQVGERLRASEEQRRQAEGRCFAAERRRLDAERRLAEVEALLEEARAAGERTRGIVVDLVALAAQLRVAIDRAPAVAGAARPEEEATAERAQMADALAAAVERLRARVAEVKAGESESVAEGLAAAEPVAAEPVATEPSTTAPHPAGPATPPVATATAVSPPRAPHKHSMSAIARWRRKRKQRKAR